MYPQTWVNPSAKADGTQSPTVTHAGGGTARSTVVAPVATTGDIFLVRQVVDINLQCPIVVKGITGHDVGQRIRRHFNAAACIRAFTRIAQTRPQRQAIESA